MTKTDLLHRDLTTALIGQYMQVSWTDIDDILHTYVGYVDDFEVVEYEDDWEDEILYLYVRDEAGKFECLELSLFELGLADDLTISVHHDLALNREELDRVLREGLTSVN